MCVYMYLLLNGWDNLTEPLLTSKGFCKKLSKCFKCDVTFSVCICLTRVPTYLHSNQKLHT